MKTLPFILLLATLIPLPAHAINKCTGAGGKIIYTDAPCPGNSKQTGKVIEMPPPNPEDVERARDNANKLIERQAREEAQREEERKTRQKEAREEKERAEQLALERRKVEALEAQAKAANAPPPTTVIVERPVARPHHRHHAPPQQSPAAAQSQPSPRRRDDSRFLFRSN